MMLVTLASDVKDPLERLRAIGAASKKTKALMGAASAALPLDFPLLGAPWLMSGLASLYGRSRLANVVPPLANVVVSNVAGPPVAVYFAGAKMLSYHPVSIPAHGMSLNITVHSYDGDLDYGLIACRRAVPDIGDLGDFMVAAHRELLAALRAPAEVRADDPIAGVQEPAAPVRPSRVRALDGGAKRRAGSKARVRA
jgi:diacylglycerol O-acyltransferase